MPHVDSVDKIVERYFACVTREDYGYKGKRYVAKPVAISPLLLRGYTCPSDCGGCCLRFSLDYLPSELRPPNCKPRAVDFNGYSVQVYSDLQDKKEHYCRHLNQENGRCGIYPVRPFSCDFELIRPMAFENEDSPNLLTQKLYGRGWNLLRIDNERGAMCEMTEPTTESVADVVRKLKRLEEWARHFSLDTWVSTIIDIIVSNRLTKKVVLSKPKTGFLSEFV
jgi:Fe-S-cluster containining protein